jgi:hypothetical protein
MARREKRVYLCAIRPRYHKATQAQKTTILDEFTAVCDYNRKVAVRLLGDRQGSTKGKKKTRPGQERYNEPERLDIDSAWIGKRSRLTS